MTKRSKFFWKAHPVFFLDEDPPAGGTPQGGDDAGDRIDRATDYWKSAVAAEDGKVDTTKDDDAAAAAAAAGGGADADKAKADADKAKADADKTAADAAAGAG